VIYRYGLVKLEPKTVAAAAAVAAVSKFMHGGSRVEHRKREGQGAESAERR